MANISSACGVITFRHDEMITRKFRHLLKRWIDTYKTREYGFYYLSEPSESFDAISILFDGCGRWTFSSTLSSPTPLLCGNLEEYNNLMKAACDEDVEITIEFNDEEAGLLVLYEEDGILKPHLEEGRWITEYIVCNNNTYDYTCKNLLELDIVDDHYEIPDDMDLILDKLKKDETLSKYNYYILSNAVMSVCEKYKMYEDGYILEGFIDDFIYKVGEVIKTGSAAKVYQVIQHPNKGCCVELILKTFMYKKNAEEYRNKLQCESDSDKKQHEICKTCHSFNMTEHKCYAKPDKSSAYICGNYKSEYDIYDYDITEYSVEDF